MSYQGKRIPPEDTCKRKYDPLFEDPSLPLCTLCKKRHVPTPSRTRCGRCSFLAGAPPLDHPRRCQAKMKNRPHCYGWARKGSRYCKYHGGNRRHQKTAGVRRGAKLFVSSFYSQYLSQTLQSLIEEASSAPAEEAYQLTDELVIARHAALGYVQAYDLLFEWHNKYKDWQGNPEDDPTDKEVPPRSKADRFNQVTNRLVVMSQEVQNSMKRVSEIAERASAIKLKHAEVIEVSQLGAIVSQLTRLLYDVCGDEHISIAKEFERLARTQIKLPTDKSTLIGSQIDPDQAILDMAQSLPVHQQILKSIEGPTLTRDQAKL